MPVPGTLSQYVSKSGGNAYHGTVYARFPERRAGRRPTSTATRSRAAWPAGPGFDVRDVNRLQRFRDFTADVGGYLKKDRAWWYGALPIHGGRAALRVAARLPPPTLAAAVADRQGHLPCSPRARSSSAICSARTFEQSNYFVASTSQPIETSDALPSFIFPVQRVEGRVQRRVTDALYVEARIGGYRSDAVSTSKSSAPRIADTGANTVSGGALSHGAPHQPPAGEWLGELHEGSGGAAATRSGSAAST